MIKQLPQGKEKAAVYKLISDCKKEPEDVLKNETYRSYLEILSYGYFYKKGIPINKISIEEIKLIINKIQKIDINPKG